MGNFFVIFTVVMNLAFLARMWPRITTGPLGRAGFVVLTLSNVALMAVFMWRFDLFTDGPVLGLYLGAMSVAAGLFVTSRIQTNRRKRETSG